MKLASLVLFLPVAVGCTDAEISTRTAAVGACGAVETHVVGIEDAQGEIVNITLDRPGNHNVVVSAKSSTRWRISTTNGARLMTVYAVGLEEQLVAVPSGTKVIKDSLDVSGTYACGFGATASDGCDPKQLLLLTSKIVSHPSSFHGCRTATTWRIGNDLTTTSNCGSLSSASPQYDSIAGCVAYQEGDNTCGDGGNVPDPEGGTETDGDGGEGGAGPIFL